MTGDPMDDRRCMATSKQSGERCKRLASPGAAVCAMHGSRAPQVRAKAAERIVEAEAGALLARNGHDAVTDPVSALSELAGEVVALKDILGGKVVELREWTYSDKPGREDVRAVLGAYERALDRCHRVLEGMTRLDLEDRLARISERQGEVIANVLLAAVLRAELPDSWHAPLRAALAAELRLVSDKGL